MFGYVIPRRDKLSQTELERYRAAYCGLCRCLKTRYGFHARFLVNYDMTFLYLLLSGEERQTERCFCPARPFCRKDCMPVDTVMEYAADLSVLLSYWKLRDARLDGGNPLSAGAGMLLYRRAYRMAAARLPEQERVFSERLAALRELEHAKCASLDRPADAFASLLRGCIKGDIEPSLRRTQELLLYHVGRYLYLVDALEDLPKDTKRGSYNPLLYRFSPQDGKLSDDDLAALVDTIEASIGMAASALELLPSVRNKEILHNIIYEGLPAVLHSVADGSFRQRGNHHEGSL